MHKIKFTKEFILVIILAILFVTLSILSPDRFLSLDNLQSMASQLPEFGILALGMMVVLVTGGINLSLSSTAALSGILGAFVLSKFNQSGNVMITVLVALVVCLLTALVCGAVNGAIVSYIGVSPILTTLGTMTLFEGISLKFTQGGAISGFPDMFMWFGNGTFLGIPIQMYIFILVVAVTIIKLEHTPWGLKVYMVGCNPVATNYSGINIKKVLLKVYLYSGFLCGLASIIMISRYNSAKVDYGSSYMMQSVSAAVLGGTDVAGGYGKVIGTVTAAIILQILSSGLNILGVNRNIVDIIMGLILILVLTINFFSSKREENKGKSKKSKKVENLSA
jgi:simple sugar transport system permease protein